MIPFTFSVMLLNLFELEERNHTLKNILVIGIPGWQIFLSKLASALVIETIPNPQQSWGESCTQVAMNEVP